MKKSVLRILLILTLFFFAWESNALAGKILVDSFSNGYIDGSKWFPREFVHHVKDGQYIAKLGNSIGMGAEVIPGIFQVELPFVDPDNIHTIQAEITLVEAVQDKQDSESKSYAYIGGYFYSVNETLELAGDIYAEICIGNRGNGLEAFWEVYKRLTNDSLQWKNLGQGTISLDEPILFGKPVTAKLAYDGNKTFEFSVNGKTVNYTGTESRIRPPQQSFKALLVGIEAFNGSDSGFISATFDNVYINNSLEVYDDFSGTNLDLSKWTYGAWVREISNGRLESILKRSNSNGEVNTILLTRDVPYFEAKVRIDSDTQLSAGASCIARLQGYYYNDSRGPGSGQEYNRNEGDVFAQLKLTYRSDGSLGATTTVERSTKADESNFSYLFYNEFRTPISLNTDHILSINFEKNKIIFSCDGETIVYNITTPVYPPYGEHRLLKSRLYLASGQTGYLKTQFDDVYIGYPSGDLNFDKKVGVSDGILGLQTITGQTPGDTLYTQADLNNDQKIGLVETLYALQIGAEIRQPVFPVKGYIGVTIQHGDPDSYALAISTSLPFSSSQATGPNISRVWQAHETHSLVNLSKRPTPGDTYTITVNYNDGSSQEKQFIVKNINDTFAFLNYPANNEIITNTTPEFAWSETPGIVSYHLGVAEIIDQEENWIWTVSFPAHARSIPYNSDGKATANLVPGKKYRVTLHTYDNEGHQATTRSTFSVQGYIGITIQHGYPDSYTLAISTSLPISSTQATGPNISHIWQRFETHSLVNLSKRPAPGDTYTITVNYNDGSSQEKQFVVKNMNDNFAFLNYPANDATITITTPEFAWSDTSGIASHDLMIWEIVGQEANWIWTVSLPAHARSIPYNSDGKATANLVPGKKYGVTIHTYDNEGHQATTVSSFSVSGP